MRTAIKTQRVATHKSKPVIKDLDLSAIEATFGDKLGYEIETFTFEEFERKCNEIERYYFEFARTLKLEKEAVSDRIIYGYRDNKDKTFNEFIIVYGSGIYFIDILLWDTGNYDSKLLPFTYGYWEINKIESHQVKGFDRQIKRGANMLRRYYKLIGWRRISPSYDSGYKRCGLGLNLTGEEYSNFIERPWIHPLRSAAGGAQGIQGRVLDTTNPVSWRHFGNLESFYRMVLSQKAELDDAVKKLNKRLGVKLKCKYMPTYFYKDMELTEMLTIDTELMIIPSDERRKIRGDINVLFGNKEFYADRENLHELMTVINERSISALCKEMEESYKKFFRYIRLLEKTIDAISNVSSKHIKGIGAAHERTDPPFDAKFTNDYEDIGILLDIDEYKIILSYKLKRNEQESAPYRLVIRSMDDVKDAAKKLTRARKKASYILFKGGDELAKRIPKRSGKTPIEIAKQEIGSIELRIGDRTVWLRFPVWEEKGFELELAHGKLQLEGIAYNIRLVGRKKYDKIEEVIKDLEDGDVIHELKALAEKAAIRKIKRIRKWFKKLSLKHENWHSFEEDFLHGEERKKIMKDLKKCPASCIKKEKPHGRNCYHRKKLRELLLQDADKLPKTKSKMEGLLKRMKLLSQFGTVTKPACGVCPNLKKMRGIANRAVDVLRVYDKALRIYQYRWSKEKIHPLSLIRESPFSYVYQYNLTGTTSEAARVGHEVGSCLTGEKALEHHEDPYVAYILKKRLSELTFRSYTRFYSVGYETGEGDEIPILVMDCTETGLHDESHYDSTKMEMCLLGALHAQSCNFRGIATRDGHIAKYMDEILNLDKKTLKFKIPSHKKISDPWSMVKKGDYYFIFF